MVGFFSDFKFVRNFFSLRLKPLDTEKTYLFRILIVCTIGLWLSWAAPALASQARVAPTITGYTIYNEALSGNTPELIFQLAMAQRQVCYPGTGTYLYHHIENYPLDLTVWLGFYTWPPNECGVPPGALYEYSSVVHAVLQCPVGYNLTKSYIPTPTGQYRTEYYCLPNFTPQKNVGGERCTVGNPCDPLTGNKSQKETDYVGTGNFPLVFKRTYNSLDTDSTESFPTVTPPAPRKNLGDNWKSNYSSFIEHLYYPDRHTMQLLAMPNPIMETAAVHRSDGQVLYFTSYGNSNTWIPDSDVNERLERTGSGWVYSLRDGSVENYNSAGQLISLRNRAGLTQNLNYNAQGRLAAVTDSFGHTLAFSYNAQGNISTLTDPAGRVLSYIYEPNGRNEKLTRVTYADGAAKLYYYENASFPNHLTGFPLRTIQARPYVTALTPTTRAAV